MSIYSGVSPSIDSLFFPPSLSPAGMFYGQASYSENHVPFCSCITRLLNDAGGVAGMDNGLRVQFRGSVGEVEASALPLLHSCDQLHCGCAQQGTDVVPNKDCFICFDDARYCPSTTVQSL